MTKIPSIGSDDHEAWRKALDELTNMQRIKVLTNANFVIDYIKSLDATDKEKATDKAMRYDAVRKEYDIRLQPKENLALYQVSQLLDSDIDQARRIKELNKDLNLNAAELERDMLEGSKETAIVLKEEQPTGTKFLTHKEHIERTFHGKSTPPRYDWELDPNNYKKDGHRPDNRCYNCGFMFVGSKYAAFCNICDNAMSMDDNDLAIPVSETELIPRKALVGTRIRIPEDIKDEEDYRRKMEIPEVKFKPVFNKATELIKSDYEQ